MSGLTAPAQLRGVGAPCVSQVAWEVGNSVPGHRCAARSGAGNLLGAASSSAAPLVGRSGAMPPAPPREASLCLGRRAVDPAHPREPPTLGSGRRVYTEECGGGAANCSCY